MRNIVKKIVAAALVLVMGLGMSACYSENNLWAAKKGDTTLSIGGYIYYLSTGFSEARAEIADDKEVLKTEIDGKSSKDFIKEKAMEYVTSYFYINDKFNEYGLEIDEDAQTDIDNSTDYLWPYYRESMEPMGISEASFADAYSKFNYMYSEVFLYRYGPDGEETLTDETLREHYEEKNFSYETMSIQLTQTNEDGESEAISDEDKAYALASIEAFKKEVEDGSKTISEAATEYQQLKSLESLPYNSTTGKVDSPSGELQEAIVALSEGDISIVETESAIYLAKRLPISEAADTMLADDDQRQSVISEMKAEDFQELVKEEAKKVTGIEYNDSAINGVNIKLLATDDTKLGTSSTPDEESSVEDESDVDADTDESAVDESATEESTTEEE